MFHTCAVFICFHFKLKENTVYIKARSSRILLRDIQVNASEQPYRYLCYLLWKILASAGRLLKWVYVLR